MPFVNLTPVPGIVRNGTEYSSKGQNSDGALVRWDEGILQPMKGWNVLASGLSGNPRNMHTWTGADFDTFVGVGTSSGIHTLMGGGTLIDRTPTGLIANDDAVWTMSNIGSSLIACMDTDETIRRWNPEAVSSAEPADDEQVADELLLEPLENAPSATAVVVTEHGFVLALGAGGNPRVVRTSNLRQPTVWTAALTNQARQFTIQTSGQLMAGEQIRGGTLLFTDQDVHLLEYTATSPLYHRLSKIPGSRGLVARNAKASVDTRCYFMGSTGFWLYNGFMQALPCTVEDDVFQNINRDAVHKVQAFHNADEQEIWWLYPRGMSTENDHYVIFNYAEGYWNHGALNRQCGIGPGGGFDLPLMCGGRKIYTHETGFDYEGRRPSLLTGWFELGEGDRVMEAFQMVPDESMQGQVRVTVQTRFYPNGPEYDYGPYLSANPMGVRFSGRQARMLIEGVSAGDWRTGGYRADVQPGGER